MKRCQAENQCKKFEREGVLGCHELCIGYVQLQSLYTMSEMPLKYQYDKPLTGGVDKANFVKLNEFKDNIVAHVENGDSVFMFSPSKGNGKTSWATKIMNEFFRKVAILNPMVCRGIFIVVPTFLQQVRDSLDRDATEEFKDEVRLKIKSIHEADLVIWDDIGCETPTNWVRERLFSYINYRESNLKSQIFTSNITPELMGDEKYLGGRIVSRVIGCCEGRVFEFKGKRDWRIES